MIQTSRSTLEIAGTGADLGGASPWSNPTRITADDASNTTWAATGGGDTSNTLKASNFGFAIPTNAVIDGILLTIDGSSFSAYTISIQIGNTSLLSDDKADGSNILTAYGGSTDLWGLELTPAIVNASDFYASIEIGDISGGDASATIDHISITVSWHYDVTVAPAVVPLRYDYKIYSPSGRFIGNLPNVVSRFSTQQDINSAGSKLNIDVASNVDGTTPVLAPASLTQWIIGEWDYRIRITIPKTAVTGELSNFPVYLDLSDLGSQFFSNVDSAGDDIRITDTYGMQELPFELVSIDTTTRTGELHFKTPILSDEYDNVFYIYYGNASASPYAATDTYGRNNVWTTFHAGVYHFNSNVNGSTSTPNNGTASGSPSYGAGGLGNGIALDGTNDYVDLGGATGTLDSTMNGMGGWNLSFLIKRASTQVAAAFVVAVNDDDAGATNKFLLGFQAGQTTLSIWSAAAGPTVVTGNITDDALHHVLVHYNTGDFTVYVDGVQTYTASGWSVSLATGDYWTIGAERDTGPVVNEFLAATVDEVRIRRFIISNPSKEVVAKAEYENQVNTDTFYEISNQQQENIESVDALIKNGNLVNVYETSYYYPNGKSMYQGQLNRIKARFDPQIDGIIRILCHSDGRDLDNFTARGAPFTYTGDQSQTAFDASFSVFDDGIGWDRCGQLWTVGVGVTKLGRIQLKLGVSGLFPSANVTISVYTDASLSTFLGTVTKFINSSGVFDFAFANPLDVVAGQDYFFTVSVGTGQQIEVYYKTANPYANGAMYTASFSGTSGGSYGSTTNDLYFTTASAIPSTQATYTSDDPTGDILPAIMDDYIDRGGNITYTEESIDPTGLSLTMFFNTNTVYEAIGKIQDASPNGFYHYVDLGTNVLWFKEVSRTADFVLVKGRHVEALDLDLSIEEVINDLLFSGGDTGGGVNLYSQYSHPTSDGIYGPRLDRKTDNRVTVQGTADAIGNSRIAERSAEQYYTVVSVLASSMDITLFKPGKTVALRAYNSFVDSILLKITRVEYQYPRVKLQIGTLPIRFNTRTDQITRGLLEEQTANNPSTPT